MELLKDQQMRGAIMACVGVGHRQPKSKVDTTRGSPTRPCLSGGRSAPTRFVADSSPAGRCNFLFPPCHLGSTRPSLSGVTLNIPIPPTVLMSPVIPALRGGPKTTELLQNPDKCFCPFSIVVIDFIMSDIRAGDHGARMRARCVRGRSEAVRPSVANSVLAQRWCD